jgi:putative hydrolase of the HAD superfamily
MTVTELRAVLFDLDDTLYPESEFVLSGFRAVAHWGRDRLGCSEDASYNRLREIFYSGIRGRTFNFWLEELGLTDPECINSAIKIYREHVPVIHLFPGVLDLLKNYHRRYLLGMVTDGDWQMQNRKIEALGIYRYFTAIILTDKLGTNYRKPSPKPFMAALEQMGVEAGAACYVGDNAGKDFFGAREVGLTAIWIRRNDGIYSGIEPPTTDHKPDYTIDSLNKLESILSASTDYYDHP